MDHSQYSLLDYTNQYKELNDVFGIQDVVHYKDIMSEKTGDELLIEMVRSRSYLYNKALADYRNTGMKENAWREIATFQNVNHVGFIYASTTAKEYNNEEWGRKNNKKEVDFARVFGIFEPPYRKRNSYCNVALKASGRAIPQATSQQASIESLESDSGKETCDLQENYDELQVTSPLNTGKRNILVPSTSNIIPANQCGRPATPSASSSSTFESESSRQTPTPVTPMRCYLNDDGKIKRPKVDPVETAFHRINSTITTMVDKICSKPAKANVGDDNDPDIIIGKLVTAKLKNTPEPKKGWMKKKCMSILYSLDKN